MKTPYSHTKIRLREACPRAFAYKYDLKLKHEEYGLKKPIFKETELGIGLHTFAEYLLYAVQDNKDIDIKKFYEETEVITPAQKKAIKGYLKGLHTFLGNISRLDIKELFIEDFFAINAHNQGVTRKYNKNVEAYTDSDNRFIAKLDIVPVTDSSVYVMDFKSKKDLNGDNAGWYTGQLKEYSSIVQDVFPDKQVFYFLVNAFTGKLYGGKISKEECLEEKNIILEKIDRFEEEGEADASVFCQDPRSFTCRYCSFNANIENEDGEMERACDVIYRKLYEL